MGLDENPMPSWIWEKIRGDMKLVVTNQQETIWAVSLAAPHCQINLFPGENDVVLDLETLISRDTGTWEENFFWRRRNALLACVVGQYCPRCGIFHLRLGNRIITEGRLTEVSVVEGGFAVGMAGIQYETEIVCDRCDVIEVRKVERKWG